MGSVGGVVDGDDDDDARARRVRERVAAFGCDVM